MRVRQGRRGAVGGVGLTVPDALVREACELAVAVAQATEWKDVPPPLRQYLRMQRLPARAVSTVRRVLDEDEAFRSAVAAAADGSGLGPASLLYVARPEGWEAELDALAREATSAATASAEEKEERSARRRLAAAEARRDAAASRVAELTAALAAAESALTAEREARDEAESRAAALGAQVDARRHERDDARARASRAEQRLAEALAAEPVPAPAPSAPEPPPAEPSVDVAALRTALQAALELLPDATPPVTSAPPSFRAEPPRRRPLPLPGGMFDDGVDAADWLVRRPGVAVVVDGYNCTLRDGPFADLPIPEQRRRLVDALTELASRTQADVEVVFDGADVDRPLAGTRRGVRVTFSEAGTEADDVVIERSRTLPVDRPVVVASSDNRVRAGAHDFGANVISAEQLMAVLRTRR